MNDNPITRRVARHEAAHAIAAMEMGLTVSWVQIHPGHAEGIDFGAAVQIPDETLDLERDLFAVCVAMAAPASVIIDSTFEIGEYAKIERQLAMRLATENGHDSGAVYDRAEEIVEDRWQDILLLADRLVEEGKVVFETV